MKKILAPYHWKTLKLKNRLVMAPMTRSRAIDNLPNDLMAKYYGQRSGAGLIITEGTAPTPESLGYARIPGIFNEAQIKGWKKITEAVHEGGSKFFIQLLHTGRIGHVDNLPPGYRLAAVSNKKANGQMFTDTKGLQEYSQPAAMTTEAVYECIRGHVQAAVNAIEAGFDGVELHGANGYLVEQFLHPVINDRSDEFGGSLENRCRFVLQLAEQTAKAIGKDKVGIRFSPYSTLGDLEAYQGDEVHQTYSYLAEQLNKIDIAYIHISLSPDVPQHTLDAIRSYFEGTLIFCNGFTPETAEQYLAEGKSDLIAFARTFLANPDLDVRIELESELNQPNPSTFYTPGSYGYIDYPTLSRTLSVAS